MTHVNCFIEKHPCQVNSIVRVASSMELPRRAQSSTTYDGLQPVIFSCAVLRRQVAGPKNRLATLNGAYDEKYSEDKTEPD